MKKCKVAIAVALHDIESAKKLLEQGIENIEPILEEKQYWLDNFKPIPEDIQYAEYTRIKQKIGKIQREVEYYIKLSDSIQRFLNEV